MNKHSDALTIVSYLIAAAIVLPLAWWLKDYLDLAEWMRSFFY